MKAVKYRFEDGTAIGAGLAKCVSLLKKSEAKSKVVILLTDGEENIREIEPIDAAKAAKEFKIRVHTIAAGRLVSQIGGFFSQAFEIDTTELEKIAKITGGKFFKARDKKALEKVWQDIDRMEKTRMKSRLFLDAKDICAPVILAGIVLMGLGVLLGSTVLGGLP